MKKEYFLLMLTIFLAFSLRFWNVSNLPAGFTADEAAHGYDAYSLLQTGKDMWGESWPVAFRSFGEYKLPVYIYTLLPFVWLGGLNVLMVRLPGVLFGTGTVLMTYLIVRELLRYSEGRNVVVPHIYQQGELIALLSAFLLTISPWHIQLSRGAFEAGLGVFFVILGLWAWMRGVYSFEVSGFPDAIRNRASEFQGSKWFILSAMALGISLHTYIAARVFVLLMLPFLVWPIWRRKLASHFVGLQRDMLLRSYGWVKSVGLPVIVFGVFLIPMVGSLFSGGSSRGLDVAIFNPTDNWQAVSDRQYEGILHGEPAIVSKIFSNKVVYVARQFVVNYVTYLSPAFLFIEGPGDATYGILPGRGLLYWFELPLILVSLGYFVGKFKAKFSGESLALGLVILLVLLAPIPASMSKGGGHVANRAATMLPFVHVLSAVGLVILLKTYEIAARRNFIFKKINEKFHMLAMTMNHVVLLFICLVVLLSLLFFAEDYVVHGPKIQAKAMSGGWQEAAEFLKEVEDEYDQIIVSRDFNEPQIFLMFFQQWEPEEVWKYSSDWMRYEDEGLGFVDQLGEYRLGKYVFKGVHQEYLKDENTLIVAERKNFLTDVKIKKEIFRPGFPEPDSAIIFVESNQLVKTDSKTN